MRKLIVILSLVFTFSIVGGLYNTLAHLDEVETITEDQAYMNQFPDPIPSFVFY